MRSSTKRQISQKRIRNSGAKEYNEWNKKYN